MGGCGVAYGGMRLPDDFGFVIALFQEERFELGPHTTRVDYHMQDCAVVPPVEDLNELADLALGHVEEGTKTLIHCQGGLNRSGLLTGMVLRLMGMNAPDAIALMRAQRDPMVLCNPTFERFLVELR
jgi:hypothetical protein